MWPVCLIRITHWVAKNAHEWGWQWSKAQNPVRTITAYAVNKENEIIVHWNTPHVRFIALAYRQTPNFPKISRV